MFDDIRKGTLGVHIGQKVGSWSTSPTSPEVLYLGRATGCRVAESFKLEKAQFSIAHASTSVLFDERSFDVLIRIDSDEPFLGLGALLGSGVFFAPAAKMPSPVRQRYRPGHERHTGASQFDRSRPLRAA